MIRDAAKVVFLGVIIGVLAGCATVQPKILNTDTTLSKKIIVKRTDLSGNEIDVDEIRKAIASTFITLGNKPYAYYETFRHGKHYDTYGIKSSVTDNGIRVEYLNGPRINTDYAAPVYYQSHITANLPMSITENGDYYNAVLDFPTQISLEPAPWLPSTSSKYLLNENEIVPNLLSKFNALNSGQIAIKRSVRIEGEITVEFNPASVAANYERKLGKYRDTQSMYNFTYAGETLPLSVVVYPYRNGSKIGYSIIIPYAISDKISISQSDLNGIKGQIEAIAKD